MDRTITYSLRIDATDSDTFYEEISAFADDWTLKTLPNVADLVDEFSIDRVRRNLPDRSQASYAFDLLVLGVLLREYGHEAIQLPAIGESLMRDLVQIQERWPKSETLIKPIRGLFYRLARSLKKKRPASTLRIDALLGWLQAIGENTMAGRLEEWRDFFRSQDIMEEAENRVLRLADDFSRSSLTILGKYTLHVEKFLENEAPRHRWRYDAALLNRTRLEYHLGMLGSEILNRANRQSFLESPHKIVILPPCMGAQPEEECKAINTKYGQSCAGCTPSCRIHQITKLGEKHGFGVYIIPEELRVFGGDEGKREMGVLGVSCVLTNWTGGWDTERLGIPAQGVLLDYVGCKYHWDRTGFPTDTNINRLISCMGLAKSRT